MKYRFILFITFLVQSLYAQNIEFKANVSKNTLGANERVRIEFTMNKNGDNFTPPSFDDFVVIMGPSQFVSESWFNGVRSFSKTYNYILQPKAKGKFTIGQASIDIDGRTYKTAPIAITVTEDVARESFFLLAEVSKPNPYLNEAVSVTYRLYVGSNVALNDLQWVTDPKFPNFLSKEIEMPNYEIGECSYQGRNYRYIVVKKVVLYPQKTGTITLEPLTMDAVLTVPTNQRAFFGRIMYEQVSRRVTSGNKTINVKDLPEEGKPDNFSGAVGDFSFAVTPNKQTLKGNESMQLKVEVSGSGNLKLFDLPKPTFPSSLEVYPPEQNDDISTTLAGMKGRIEQTYTIVPQYKGKYPISGVAFSYFNPNTHKYETIKTDELWIDVTEGAPNENTPTDVANDNTLPSSQFRAQQPNTGLVAMHQPAFFGSVRYYLYLLLPLLLIPIALIAWRIRQRRAGDIEGAKVRTANRLAKKYLSEAKRKLADKDHFYEALERALHNYLKAKLKIETTEMSKDKINELLLARHAAPETVERFIQLLANCEMARYSQHHTDASVESDFGNAVQVITELDKQVKK